VKYTDTFAVASADGTTTSVTVNINGTNEAPVAVDDAWIVSQTTPVKMPLVALLGNDSDLDGGTLSVTAFSSDGLTWDGLTSHGVQVAMVSEAISLNEGNRTGTDGFWYQISDGQGGTATGHVSISIQELKGGNAIDTVNLSNRTYDYSYIDAGGGNDSITGGSTVDYLIGGNGNDLLIGKGGNDILTGAHGNDTFKFLALGDRTDTITDFEKYVAPRGNGNPADFDTLNIHDLLSGFTGINGAHDNAFSGGYLRFDSDGSGGTNVNVDSDGSGGANPFVTLATLTNVLLLKGDDNNYVL
jgi:Ca2+-binding RTX toxin-like protein